MKHFGLACFVSAVVVLAGCSAGSGGGAGGGGGSTSGGGGVGGGGGSADSGVDAGIPLSQACRKVAEASCDRSIRCKVVEAADKDVCIAVRAAQCTYEVDVGHGASSYDGTATAACV